MISSTILLKTFFYTCLFFMLFSIKGCFRKNNPENSSKIATNNFVEQPTNKKGHMTSLNAPEFKALINNNNVQLIDVRTQKEYNQGKIEGAILIDLTSKNFDKQVDTLLSVDIPVAVYCQSGGRSLMASKILVKKGFTVYNLKAGYNSWK